MEPQLVSVVNAINASQHPEWTIPVTDFYFINTNDKRSRLLSYLWEGRDNIAELSRFGQWTSFFRLPQQISPVAYHIYSDFNVEITKWINLNWVSLQGKRCFEVGCGTGLNLMMLSAFNIECAGCELSPQWRTGAALSAALNNLEFDLEEDDSNLVEYDVIFFPTVFDDESYAASNLEKARELRRMGKQVIISSTSLWNGHNRWASLLPGEGLHRLSLNWMTQREVFELV